MDASLKSSIVRVLTVLIISLLLAVPFSASNSEGDALYAFKQNLLDPAGYLTNWDPTSVDPCLWFYVTCDSNNFVVRLDLLSASLSGSLVPDLGSLGHLQYLVVFNNSISGPIPEELGQLRNLVGLELSFNALTGALPATLGQLSALQYLHMKGNLLTGEIPVTLTTMPSLYDINLAFNDLTGVVPQFPSKVHTEFEGNPHLGS